MSYDEENGLEKIAQLEKAIAKVKQEWEMRLTKAGLTSKTCTLFVSRIYRDPWRKDGYGKNVSTDNSFEIKGVLKEENITIKGTICWLSDIHDHYLPIFSPSSSSVDSVTFNKKTVEGAGAKEMAQKLIPLTKPYTSSLERMLGNEKFQLRKWQEGAPDRERLKLERLRKSAESEKAEKKAISLLQKAIGKRIDIRDEKFHRGTFWGSDSYDVSKSLKETNSPLSLEQRMIEYDKTLWEKELAEKFNLTPDDIHLTFQTSVSFFPLDEMERYRRYGKYHGHDERECTFTITGTIKDLPVYIKGSTHVSENKDIRGFCDFDGYDNEELTIGEVSKSWWWHNSWALIRVIDSLTPPSPDFLLRKERERIEDENRKKKEAQKGDEVNSKLDSLLGK